VCVCLLGERRISLFGTMLTLGQLIDIANKVSDTLEFELEGHTTKFKYKKKSVINSGGQGGVYLFERVGDAMPMKKGEDDSDEFTKRELDPEELKAEEEVLHPQCVALKIEPTVYGRRERDTFKRVYNGKYCCHIVRVLKYMELDYLDADSGMNIPLSIIVMEKCDTNVKSFLANLQRRNTSPKEMEYAARHFFIQLCDGLKYMRDRGVIHRDIKPDNLLLRKYGNEYVLKIIDFGIAKKEEHTVVSQTTKGIGTESFVAPEDNEHTHKFDVWSAGVVLYSMLTGRDALFVTLPAFRDKPVCARNTMFQKNFSCDCLDFKVIRWVVTDEFKDTLKLMLAISPDQRADWEAILESKWLTAGAVVKRVSFKVKTRDNFNAIVEKPYSVAFMSLPILGAGATGIVFKGNLGDKVDDSRSKVAVKRIRKSFTDAHGKEELLTEAAVLRDMKDLGHPNIIKFYGLADMNATNQFDSMTFIFEYCPTTLSSRIGSGLSEFVAHKFMKQIIEGLKALLSKGYIHRDIKPENILIRFDKFNRETAVVTDLGFALKKEKIPESGRCGTPGFIAPEVDALKKGSEKMDIYSLGITLIQMISGSVPASDSPECKRLKFVTLPNKMRCDVTDSCWRLIQRMTMKDPNERISYEELWKDPWICAKPEDLAMAYTSDRTECARIVSAGRDKEEPVVYMNEAIKLKCELIWPINVSVDVRKKKSATLHAKKFLIDVQDFSALSKKREDFLREFVLKRALAFAHAGAACETVLPLRAIKEYKIAAVYVWLFNVCNDPVKDLMDDFSARISMLESRH